MVEAGKVDERASMMSDVEPGWMEIATQKRVLCGELHIQYKCSMYTLRCLTVYSLEPLRSFHCGILRTLQHLGCLSVHNTAII